MGLRTLTVGGPHFLEVSMAQHILISEEKLKGEKGEEAKALRKIIKEFRTDLREVRETDDLEVFDSKYSELTNDQLDKGETSGVFRHIDVPESLVYGGRATFEARLRMSIVSKMYLIA